MLDDILTWANLCNAWERVADNEGSPGPDRVTIARFALHWEDNLRRLQELVRARRYRPGQLRRVAIPKPHGGQRLLRIPNVGDRVLQRAVLNVLELVFEQRFLDCSFGYRPRRGLHQAVAAILALRDRDFRWVFDADIDDCFDSFDSFDLQLLSGFLEEDIVDSRLRHLIQLWIGVGRRYTQPDRGIALGMPISPLLCNIYLHRMDWQLVRRRWALVRYADDFIICCETADQAVQAQRIVEQTLADLKLRLEPRKTRITSFDDGFEFLGVAFDGDGYSFTWQDKRFRVEGPTPLWLWGYVPDSYT